MKKSLLLIIFLVSSLQVAFAEKIPVKITPAQIITTDHDEIEVGDRINFTIVNDIYINDKLYLEKGTPIYGKVDFFHPNGWAGDNADIKLVDFKTTDINDKTVVINYPLNINGNTLKANDIKQYISWITTILIRGSEINIEPDTKVFNIFIEQ